MKKQKRLDGTNATKVIKQKTLDGKERIVEIVEPVLTGDRKPATWESKLNEELPPEKQMVAWLPHARFEKTKGDKEEC